MALEVFGLQFCGCSKVCIVCSVAKNLDLPIKVIPKTQSTTSLPIYKNVTSCLTYIFKIGAEERESTLVIIPNHMPLRE